MNTLQPVRAHLVTLSTYAALSICAACSGGLEAAARSHPLLGKEGAPLVADAVGGEGPKTLAEARGKVVILDFWATWCAPCRAAFPTYQAIVDRFPGEVAVLAVSEDETAGKTKADLLAFSRETHTRFSILWDRDGSSQATYQPLGFPSTFILDRNGVVRRMHAGYGPGYTAALTREVEELLRAGDTGPASDMTAHLATRVDALEASPEAALRVMSCEAAPPDELSRRIARFHAGNPAGFHTCASTEGCMSKMVRAFKCTECLKASCCAEARACSERGFAPGSSARAGAARCGCLFNCRRTHPLAECLSAERCGPAPDNANGATTDPYPAHASCVDAHCSDVCQQEHGGPP